MTADRIRAEAVEEYKATGDSAHRPTDDFNGPICVVCHENWPCLAATGDSEGPLDVPKPKRARIDWSNVVVDEGDEAP